MEWYDKENLKLAYKYIRQETEITSLPIGPLWYPTVMAIDELGENFFNTLEKFLKTGEYRPDEIDHIFIPKDNFGARPVAIMTITDKIIYQALLNPEFIGGQLDKQFFSCSYANRLLFSNNAYVQNWRETWNGFNNDAIKAFNQGFVYYIELDVRSYYPSIVIDKLCEILSNSFNVDKQFISIISRQLKTWDKKGIGTGLPQGPIASSVLANAYLHPLDLFINEQENKNIKYFRYADDIVIMAKNDGDLSDAVNKVNVFLYDYNLELNEKTRKNKLKSGKYLENKKYYSSYDESTILTSIEKLLEIEKKIPKILKGINSNNFSKQDISSLKYYLKSDYHYKYTGEILKIIPKMPSLVHFIAQYFDGEAIDENLIYKTITSKGNGDWVIFWLLKLLFSFGKPPKKMVDEIFNNLHAGNYHYAVKLMPVYYRVLKEKVIIDSDFFRKCLVNATSTVEANNYLFLAARQSNIDLSEDIKKSLLSTALDKQIVALYLSKSQNVKTNKFPKSLFSGLFLKEISGYKKKNIKSVKENELQRVLIAEHQFKRLMQTNRHKKTTGQKTIINFDADIGIYREQKKKKLIYPIKNRGKRRMLLNFLIKNRKTISANGLIEICGYKDPQTLSKEIKKINELFLHKLKLEKKLITHSETGGYKINRDVYSVKIRR